MGHSKMEPNKRTFEIYRHDPDTYAKPRTQTIELELGGSERMSLDALNKLTAVDPSQASATRPPTLVSRERTSCAAMGLRPPRRGVVKELRAL
jgi:hypothetical protein